MKHGGYVLQVKIPNQDISKWNVSNVENMNSMFITPNYQQRLSTWMLAS
ncbi:MAG: BspA family leucine-rich repeat surface protein [Candidatus Thiodubiliella endoseptemdiera]|uniref:BspA family leucine-rich repeat surface protein n=1 Tax=Candidatus Thiodubiliella endoseptemdiera TaxID=2738886 RepID=A0A853F3J5_9GAMM|nr:BspA family leucine-rich repeat surface protein [Candidatus Thiodubiliella endoseptemdiera]